MLITVGSITTAARLAAILERNTGCPAETVHTPAAVNKGGCSYSVRFPEQHIERAREPISEYKVPVKKYYSETICGGRREYHDISR